MTSTRPDTVAQSAAADRAQTFLDWTRINAKLLTTGAVVVAVAAAGYWFYLRSTQIQATNAERALLTAKQSMTAGNLPLAQKDLQNVYAKYASTSAGVQAAMLLAQIDFDGGKFQDGLSVLQKVAGSSAASGVQATILSLEGDGYAQMKKLAEAGKARRRGQSDVVRDRTILPAGEGGSGIPGGWEHRESQGDLDGAFERPQITDDVGRGAGSARRAFSTDGQAIAQSLRVYGSPRRERKRGPSDFARPAFSK